MSFKLLLAPGTLLKRKSFLEPLYVTRSYKFQENEIFLYIESIPTDTFGISWGGIAYVHYFLSANGQKVSMLTSFEELAENFEIIKNSGKDSKGTFLGSKNKRQKT